MFLNYIFVHQSYVAARAKGEPPLYQSLIALVDCPEEVCTAVYDWLCSLRYWMRFLLFIIYILCMLHVCVRAFACVHVCFAIAC